ncbi:MAG: low molecular weight phosphatase family protein [Tagaea sp.]|nr:low molecular weight phosphatase family protein [Tagaea sp.]
MTGKIGSVLFCCTHNSVRSPMAEGLAKKLLGTRVYVDSAGVRRQDIDPFVIASLGELGVDIQRHKAKTFDELHDSSFDLIVTLSPEAHHKALELTRIMACDVEYWPTFDPTLIEEGSREARLEGYRALREGLKARILKRFPELAIDFAPPAKA